MVWASGGGGFAGYGVVWGEKKVVCGFVDRSQKRGRVKGLVDLGLGCGLFVIWAQSVDQASVGLVLVNYWIRI